MAVRAVEATNFVHGYQPPSVTTDSQVPLSPDEIPAGRIIDLSAYPPSVQRVASYLARRNVVPAPQREISRESGLPLSEVWTAIEELKQQGIAHQTEYNGPGKRGRVGKPVVGYLLTPGTKLKFAEEQENPNYEGAKSTRRDRALQRTREELETVLREHPGLTRGQLSKQHRNLYSRAYYHDLLGLLDTPATSPTPQYTGPAPLPSAGPKLFRSAPDDGDLVQRLKAEAPVKELKLAEQQQPKGYALDETLNGIDISAFANVPYSPTTSPTLPKVEIKPEPAPLKPVEYVAGGNGNGHGNGHGQLLLTPLQLRPQQPESPKQYRVTEARRPPATTDYSEPERGVFRRGKGGRQFKEKDGGGMEKDDILFVHGALWTGLEAFAPEPHKPENIPGYVASKCSPKRIDLGIPEHSKAASILAQEVQFLDSDIPTNGGPVRLLNPRYKDGLVALHKTLRNVLNRYAPEDQKPGNLPEYKELGISPIHVHRSKRDHRKAVLVLAETLKKVAKSELEAAEKRKKAGAKW